MCGICGFISKKSVMMNSLIAMNQTMTHRGPDDHGEEIFECNGLNIGLAQRRLSIFDLSLAGHQPMHSYDNRIIVVFNGEIYNFQELRKELSDYPFVSNTDTEVIVAAYLKYGIQCVNKFNGMFAIAIFDRETKDFYLLRDRIGKKPLYYWFEKGELVFASELKPIMKFPGIHLSINSEILPQFLFQQYINAPDSIFINVSKLAPGAVLRYSAGKISVNKYWDIAKKHKKLKAYQSKNFQDYKEGLQSRLKEAVRLRLFADVPVGTFLSGGYDSSLVTALAQSVSTQPINTYSIGFSEKKFNEAEYAKKVASYLGTKHTELYVTEKDFHSLLEQLVYYYDEPFADSSQIPSMAVAELAKREVTVVLSGDGGDEFFGGYKNHYRARIAQWLDLPGNFIYQLGLVIPFDKILPFSVRCIAQNRYKECKTQLYAPETWKLIESITNACSPETMLFPEESKYHENNWAIRNMLLDMEHYLPGDILHKVDRASMRYSLETRCPLLDVNVMEYALSIPQKYKIHNGTGKYILKELAYDYIPREYLERPKQGFSIPLDKWLRGELKEEILDYADTGFLKSQGFFSPEVTHNKLEEYMNNGNEGRGSGKLFSGIWWSFYVFQKWYIHYMHNNVS